MIKLINNGTVKVDNYLQCLYNKKGGIDAILSMRYCLAAQQNQLVKSDFVGDEHNGFMTCYCM